MCNLYSMTATVDEMRRIFGSFEGDTSNLPAFDEIYPGYMAPVLRRREQGGLKLEMMKWGFPGPAAAPRIVPVARSPRVSIARPTRAPPAAPTIRPVVPFERLQRQRPCESRHILP